MQQELLMRAFQREVLLVALFLQFNEDFQLVVQYVPQKVFTER